MPRKSTKLAVVRRLKRQTTAQKKMIKELRSRNRAKRMISKGLLLPAAGMTTTIKTRKRRSPSAKSVTISVKAGGRKKTISVLPACSTAGRTLKKKGTGRKPVNRAASKAGRTLATAPCRKGARKVSTTTRKTTATKRKTTSTKRRTTTKSGGNIVSKVLKNIFGGGKKSSSSAIKLPKVGVKKSAPKKSTAKRVVRKSSSSKLARIKRIVC